MDVVPTRDLRGRFATGVGFWTGKKRGPLSEKQRNALRLANTGKKLSDHTKELLRRASTGRRLSERAIALLRERNRTRVVSDETRRKMSDAHKRIGVPWLIGKTIPEERKQRIAAKLKANPYSHWLGRRNPHCSGAKNHFWRGGVSTVNRGEREEFMRTVEYKEWRRKVFERDGFVCMFCGDATPGLLRADHIKPYVLFPEWRLSVDNGRTLCDPCHRKTDTYGTRALKYHEKEITTTTN